VKRFTLFAGFLLLATAVAIPLLLKKDRTLRFLDNDTLRYDIDDYMAAEGL
jgi:hypothetical protein